MGRLDETGGISELRSSDKREVGGDSEKPQPGDKQHQEQDL